MANSLKRNLLSLSLPTTKLLFFLLASLSIFSSANCESVTLEYQVKASLLYNFLLFVDWPEDEPSNVFNLCIYGQDRFGATLGSIEKEIVKGHQIRISKLNNVDSENLYQCQLLFLVGNNQNTSSEILKIVRNQSILTVGEFPGFLEMGGIVNFLVQDKKVMFEINKSAANGARLILSSKLLRLAQRVT